MAGLMAAFIALFVLGHLFLRIGVLRPINKAFSAGQETLDSLRSAQADQAELLEQIKQYRNGLYALGLVLEARKNVANGSDEQNPYLVYDYTQVLNDLRRLLPKDARVTKFQVNNKGLITLPVESVDYASLGRVLKSFKDKSAQALNRPEEPKLFSEVKIPAGAQREVRQTPGPWGFNRLEQVYSFSLQATLNPEFWQNPMPYPDVDSLAYYAQAIRDLTIAGTIEGYGDGNFRPDQAINRAEFFKLSLFEFLSSDAITIEEYKQFIDLSEKDWHYQYIQLASQMGIAEGDEVGRFHPDQPVARAEALKALLKIFQIEPPSAEHYAEGLEEGQALPSLPYGDVPADSKHYALVRLALEKGLLDQTQVVFRPNDPITRAEMAYWTWKLKFDYL